MTSKSKRVFVQLLDPQNERIIAEGLIDATLVASLDRLEYEIHLTVEGFRPELNQQKILVRLKNGKQGYASLVLLGDPGKRKTQFEVFVRNEKDPIWQSLI